MRALLAAGLLLAVSACGPKKEDAPVVRTPEMIAAASQNLKSFLDQAFEEELQKSPMQLTQMGRKEQYDKLDDFSEAAEDAALEWRRKSVADMKAEFSPEELNDEAKTSYDIWALELERSELETKYKRHAYVFGFGGPHTDLPSFIMTYHKVDDKSDMDAYNARLGAMAVALDQWTERAKLAAAHYFKPTPDGKQPGIFYAHLIDMKAVSVWALESLSYHEGVPGHHMQIAIATELDNLPVFRTQYMYTAFTEGWGLYAEGLGKEMGFFTDPYNDFGRLSSELWRAVRLVVDTGLHSKGWTEEEGVAWALANSPRPEAAIRSEVRRFISWPGQATAYKIGQLKILELRENAKKELGDKFDIRGFHDTVIDAGSLPLPVLEKRVQRWVEELKGMKA